LLPQRELLDLMVADPVPEVSPKESRRAVSQAVHRSTVRPRASNMMRAVVVYDYLEGAVYEVTTKAQQPTVLVFTSPERAITASPNDWFLTEIYLVGEEPNQQSHVVIIPKGPDLEADLVIITTRAVYHLHVRSSEKDRMVAVRWKHQDTPAPFAPVPGTGIYYTDYDITVTAGTPEWTPLEVWDTGLNGHTLIRMPERVAVGEAPLLYVIADDGQSHLVNWAPRRGHWYVVNRLLKRAELRVGHEGQEVVRISRGASYRAVWCPSPVDVCPEGGS
jgi:type IV secretory pathway VirB9-like protein